MASPTRMVNITGDGAEIIRNRIEERGYSSFNDHLISQKIYNILAKAVYSNKTPISLRKVLVTELQK